MKKERNTLYTALMLASVLFSCPLTHTAQQRTITRKNFVADIVGSNEERMLRRFMGMDSHGALYHIDWDRIDRWKQRYGRRRAIFQGTLTVPTITQLDRKVNARPMPGRGTFRLQMNDPRQPHLNDIRYLQANPDNKGAAFQVELSFFGPLSKGMSGIDVPLAKLASLPTTQGKDAELSAGGAFLYRKLFMADEQQHNQVYYLLHGLYRKLPIRSEDPQQNRLGGQHGYSVRRSDEQLELRREKAIIPEGLPYVGGTEIYIYDPEDEKQVAVGIHHNIYVTSGYGGTGENGRVERLSLRLDDQRITQIFTSALDIEQARRLNNGQLGPNAIAAAKMLLNAAYEGTIKAAYTKGIRKLYLTVVGSADNNISWIENAIARMAPFIQASGMEVILVCRPETRDRDFIERMRTLEGMINGGNPDAALAMQLDANLQQGLLQA